jgi:hypothetical protein
MLRRVALVTHRLHSQSDKNRRARNNISKLKTEARCEEIVTLTMEAIRPSDTSVLTRATRRHVPEDGILCSHRHEHLKSYIVLTGWTL